MSCLRRDLLFLALLAACDAKPSAPGATDAGPSARPLLEAAEEQAPPDAGPQKRGAAQQAGERVDVPAGSFVAGSTPGDLGRDPSLEPAELALELGAFAIDRLPYPNDPRQPPLGGVTRERAASLCGERGGRLCSELEWERACQGPNANAYSGATSWDTHCGRSPETCASGFGVLALGGAMREWTASDVAPIRELIPRAAAVRGARADAAAVDHRCAHRSAVDPKAGADDLGFRCCYGPESKAAIPSPDWQATVRRTEFPPARLSEMFAANERLRALSGEVKYFREDNAVATVKRRSETRAADAGVLPPNAELTTAPILWNPVPGEEILVATGQAGEHSFIVAFHKLPGDRYRVGAAFVLEKEPGPIVLVYQPLVRRSLEWTTCYGCYAGGGYIRYREENRLSISQE